MTNSIAEMMDQFRDLDLHHNEILLTNCHVIVPAVGDIEDSIFSLCTVGAP